MLSVEVIFIVQDDGRYNCTTQRGYTNSIKIRVTSVSCGAVPLYDGVVMTNVSGAEMFSIGTRVSLFCPPGYKFHGEDTVHCRDDGQC